MDNEDIYIEIKNPTLCIICLEELDENITNICVKCNVKCHKKCLHNWHKNKRKNICPICLKTKKFYEKKNIRIEENNIEELENNNNENIIEQGEIIEEEIIEDEEEEDEEREQELINYYLHRQNNNNICYLCVNELCCSKRSGSYILISILLLYTYTSMM